MLAHVTTLRRWRLQMLATHLADLRVVSQPEELRAHLYEVMEVQGIEVLGDGQRVNSSVVHKGEDGLLGGGVGEGEIF